MAASYPSGFDTMGDPGANLSTNPHSTMHNQINDVAEAIEAELGLNPSGASATVAARFTADEALISKSYTVCTSGTRPSSPTEGDKIFETDTNKILVYSGSAWSTIGPVHGALTAWTPGLVQNGVVTLSVNYAVYQRIGRMIHAQAVVTCTGAGTAANPVTCSLPVVASASLGIYNLLGTGTIADTTGATLMYPAFLRSASTTTVKFQAASVGGTDPSYLGVTGFTAALASGDIISIDARYEAAGDA